MIIFVFIKDPEIDTEIVGQQHLEMPMFNRKFIEDRLTEKLELFRHMSYTGNSTDAAIS